MSLTVTIKDNMSAGDLLARVATLAFDTSYPTGGEPLAANALRLGRIVFLLAEPSAGYVFTYDYTNSKLLAYYADYDAVADGALIQVPDTTNLGALTAVRLIAFGV